MTTALYGPWTFSVLYYESPTSIYSTAAGAHHKGERERVSEGGPLFQGRM